MADPLAKRWGTGYGAAAAAVVGATLLRFAVDPFLGDAAQFVTFFVAIVLTGAVAGRKPAFLATVLSIVAVEYFFILPARQHLLPTQAASGLTVGMFAMAAGFIAWIAGRMHNAQSKARTQADRATGILDSMGDGYLAIDRRWTITAINGAAERMLHMHCHQMVDRSLWDCFPEAVGSRFQHEYERVLRDNTSAQFEEFFPPLDTWFDVSAYPTPEGLVLFFRDITQRKQAEDDNRRNEARLESLLRISQHRAASIQELLDVALEEAIALTGSRIGYVYHYDDTKNEFTLNTWSRDAMKQCAITEQQTIYQLEKTGIWGEAVRQARPIVVNDFHAPDPLKKGLPDGHAPLHKFMTVPVVTDGHIVGVVGVANKETDYDSSDVRQLTLLMDSVWKITDRKRSEQALHEQREWLRVTLSSIGDAVLAADTDGRVTFLNPVAARLTGWTQDEAIGQPASNVFPIINEQTRQPADDVVARVLRDRQVVALANHTALLTREGREIPIEDSAAPILDAGGNVMGAVLVFHDVAAKRRAQEALQQAKEELEQRVAERTAELVDSHRSLQETSRSLEAFFQHSLTPLVFLDRQFNFIRVNEAYAKVCQRPASEFPGHNHFEYYPHAENQAIFEEVVRSRKAYVVEAKPFEFPDHPEWGVTYWDWTLVPMLNASGEVDFLVFSMEDVTARKRAELELAKHSKQLEERAGQLRMLSSQLVRAEQHERQRVAHILHEHFQQLLAGAKFDVSLLQSQLCGQDACKAPPILERINQVLDRSIAESRSLSVELSPPILYAGCLADALNWLGRWMQDKHGLAVEVQADRATNPPAEDIRILLFHAVRELLFNVVKHARAKQASVQLAACQPDLVRVIVRDDGVGFVPEQLRLKADAASGFGLFSLRERLALLGGRLEIDSRPGDGTSITLEVSTPAQRALLQPDGSPQALPVAQDDSAPGTAASRAIAGKIRVLLVDDHIVVRDGLARLLQLQSDIQVIGQAADGRQAVDLARQLCPDVILMDISMPILGGVEATRLILAHQPQSRVIGLSMHGEDGVAASMAEAGAINYLPKTTRPDSLVAAIRAAVQNPPG